MKNKLMMVGVLLSVFYMSCEDDEATVDPCPDLATAYTDATTAWTDALAADLLGDHSALCNASAVAYKAGLDAGCDGYTQADYDELVALCSIVSASVSGTYTSTSITMHPGGDCSADDGISGMCTTDWTVMTEADCPTGMCEDEESDEENCPDSLWMTGMCLDEYGDGWDDEEAHTSEAACENLGGEWMTLGWVPLIDLLGGFSFTFSDDGTYTDPNGDGGAWTLDGSTLTMADSEGETITATVSGNTITIEDAYEAHCDDDTYTDEQSCGEAGYDWQPAECVEIVITK
jgi:hypothetical protein